MIRTFSLLALLFYPLLGACEAPLAVDIKRLTLESANKIAWGAIEECRKKGIQIGVVVMDRGGHPQVVLRDTLAADLTLAIAQKKAYTALSFNVPTANLTTQRMNSGLAQHDALLMSVGGIPIHAGGIIYGSVGVSGAPNGEDDAKCAQAGINLLLKELDFDN